MTELIQTLVSKLNIQEGQAKSGAGLLFKLAKEKLGGEFSAVEAAVPGAKDLIAAAPAAGGGAKLVGGLLGALGGQKGKGLAGLAELAGGFSQLNLDKSMIAQFIPIVLDFAKGKGGQQVVALLAKVLKA